MDKDIATIRAKIAEVRKEISEDAKQIATGSVSVLGKIHEFWLASKWYLVGILLMIVFIVYYNKRSLGNVNMAVVIVLAILFMLVIMISGDNKGAWANSVPFAVHPLPPHLGLDGVSNDIRYAN